MAKINNGANPDIKGEIMADSPSALNTANENQNIMDIPIAIPIPYNVPLFPIKKEKGTAINTIIKLENGNAYL